MTVVTPSILSDAAALRGGCCTEVEKLFKSAPPRYEMLKMQTFIQTNAGTLLTGVSLERFEPCEGKLSRTVLRGA